MYQFTGLIIAANVVKSDGIMDIFLTLFHIVISRFLFVIKSM